ncbi:hypothetical protein STA3757_27900 [Stanieria sp. NIES-3757]|nr:hypothetical protein STA3757_27900 [Stanieria sp. NIES-3757]
MFVFLNKLLQFIVQILQAIAYTVDKIIINLKQLVRQQDSLSSKAILQPTSLWQFVLSLASFVGGYQLFTTGRLNI